jgi:hypothetical protein
MKQIITILAFLTIVAKESFAQTTPQLLYSNSYDFQNSSGIDMGVSIISDAVGNAFVTGYTDGGANTDILTVCYDSKGVFRWAKTYNGTGNATDRGVKIVTDNTNVYITGVSAGLNTSNDIVTISYRISDGNENWVSRFNAPTNGADSPADIERDGNGNLYIAGTSFNLSNSNSDDAVLIKYNAQNGSELWYRDVSSSDPDYVKDMAVSTSGKIFLSVSTIGFTSSRFQVFDAGGNILAYPTPLSSYFEDKEIISIAVSGSDELYYAANMGTTCIVGKMQSNLLLDAWIKFFPNIACKKIVLDNNANPFLLIYDTTLNVSPTAYQFRKLDGINGNIIYTSTFDPTNGLDYANDMVLGSQSAQVLYIAGHANVSGSKQIKTVGYNSTTGNALWTLTESCSGNGYKIPYSISLDGHNHIYIAGENTCNGGTDLTAIKYCGRIPSKPTISVQTQTALTTLMSSSSQFNQWWLNGSLVSGANSNTYNITSPSQFGYYQTEVSFSGCSTFSDSVLINIVSIEESTIGNLQLYPNPATNRLFVESNGMVITEVDIYNSFGNLISQTKQPHNIGIDISGLSNGIYSVVIKTQEATINKRFLKM